MFENYEKIEIDGRIYHGHQAVFVQDMQRTGRAIRFYRGRSFWRGPAVRCSNLREVRSVAAATSVELQHCTACSGYIVHPADTDWRFSDPGVDR